MQIAMVKSTRTGPQHTHTHTPHHTTHTHHTTPHTHTHTHTQTPHTHHTHTPQVNH